MGYGYVGTRRTGGLAVTGPSQPDSAWDPSPNARDGDSDTTKTGAGWLVPTWATYIVGDLHVSGRTPYACRYWRSCFPPGETLNK